LKGTEKKNQTSLGACLREGPRTNKSQGVCALTVYARAVHAPGTRLVVLW